MEEYMDKLELYEIFNWNYKDSSKYQRTGFGKHKEGSKNSYSFKIEGIDNKDIKTKSKSNQKEIYKKITERLRKEFNIKDDLFEKKFEMACSGSGDEIQKITALHSSSLCVLLFFYNVENKPLRLEIEKGKTVEFSKSFFEWKNPVFGNDSNIDVVLYSEKSNILLFLESKFSEYCKGQSKYGIPFKYATDPFSKHLYSEICKKENGNFKTDFKSRKIKFGKELKDGFYLETKKGTNYIEGIKQMISHYIGIINFLNGNSSEKERYEKEIPLDEKTQFYLGEILFDEQLKNFPKNRKEKYFDKYKTEYEKLENILNGDVSKRTKKNFKIIPRILCYSELMDYISENNKCIKNYYF